MEYLLGIRADNSHIQGLGLFAGQVDADNALLAFTRDLACVVPVIVFAGLRDLNL